MRWAILAISVAKPLRFSSGVLSTSEDIKFTSAINGLVARVGIKLAVNVFGVRADGGFGQGQNLTDLYVGQPLGQKSENIEFSCRQRMFGLC